MGVVAKANTTEKSISKKIKNIIISQPKPDGEKSPYFDLEKRFGVQLQFHPFVLVEGIDGKEFRTQKIDIHNYSAIIFTSRFAVDHFFRICNELKVKVNPEMKYFCITETIALYLQKFTTYRKRKVFFGNDGSIKSLLTVIAKHKSKEKYIVPCSDINKKDIIEFLVKQELQYTEATLYKTICNNVKDVLKNEHDMIVFFSPGGVKSLFENLPKYKQNGNFIAAFGPTTSKAVEESGLKLHLKAPLPNAPSMASALEQFLIANKKAK